MMEETPVSQLDQLHVRSIVVHRKRTRDLLDPRPLAGNKTVPVRNHRNALGLDELDDLFQPPQESRLRGPHLLRAAVDRERRDARLDELRNKLERRCLLG